MSNKYPLALPEGTILMGQYVIEKALGQGGFGITYKARDHKTGNTVAIKEFFPETLATRTQCTVVPFDGERGDNYEYGKTCFLQEAETLAQFIGNENIVKIYSYFEEYGTAYFVMEFIEGINFDDFIKQRGGKVSYEEAENVLIKIIEALSIVHSKGIVHRDVTPDNIYITNDGTVKLLDFGAARYSIGDKSRSLDVVLKHGFAPKEQYTRHGKQGPFTDVYTVGASFYFGLTGKRPPDSIDRIETDDLIPPSNLGVDIPRDKEEAILKALSVQPADRFQTMAQFKNALCGETSVVGAQTMTTGEAQQRVFAQQDVQPLQQNAQPLQRNVQPEQQVQMASVAAPVNTNPQRNGNNQMQNIPPNGKKRKTKSYVGVGVAAFICILAALLVPTFVRNNEAKNQKTTNERKSTYAEETTTKKESTSTEKTKATEKTETTEKTKTTEKTTTSNSFGEVDSRTINNIVNVGCYSNNGKIQARTFGNQLYYYSDGWQFVDKGLIINSVNAYEDSLIYVNDGKIKYFHDGEVTGIKNCDYGEDYVQSVYAIGDGAFVVKETSGKLSLSYFSWENGKSPWMRIIDDYRLVTFMNDRIYYIYQNKLYEADMEMFYDENAAKKSLCDFSDKGTPINMVSENGYIYILSEADSVAHVTRYDTSNGKVDVYDFSMREAIAIAINVQNGLVYLLVQTSSDDCGCEVYTFHCGMNDLKSIYKMKSHNDTTMFGINVWNEESFILMGYDEDEDQMFTLSTYTKNGEAYAGEIYSPYE